MLDFLWGFCFGLFILEPIVINFIYLSNPALFNDIILTKKNSEKLRCYYEKNL